MLVTSALGQAWELFFTAFARANFVYRPFFAEPRASDTLTVFNALTTRLHKVIDNWTFFPLRNLVIRSVVEGIRPTSRAEAEAAMDQLEVGNFGENIVPNAISDVQPAETRELLQGLSELTIGHLRNRVVHKRAYRPLRLEAERCLEDEVRLLYRAEHSLGVGSFDEFAAGVM
jgi:hypothetical protein